MRFYFFFFNDTATTEIYTLSLHDALPIFNVAGRVYRRAERRPRSTHGWRRRAALGVVLRRRHRIQAARYRDGVQGLAPERRAPPPDAQNYRGVGNGTEDIRPHRWVGWQTPLGRTGLCCYTYGPARVGLRRLAIRVRHGRARKRPRASESGRGRQGRRLGRSEHRAAVHKSGTPRRDTRRPRARFARRGC